MHNDVAESMFRRRNRMRPARSRAPRADQLVVRAWTAQTCGLHAHTTRAVSGLCFGITLSWPKNKT
eukprot:11199760-Lingulodinium_polyedra.AAC.1